MLRAMPKSAPQLSRATHSRLFRRGLFVAVLLQFAAHALTVAPGVTPSDGPEIAAAVVALGVIHPTGYPLFTLVAHAFTWLPLPVEAVIKIELMNASFAAGASVFVALVVRTIALRLQGALPPPARSLTRLWPRVDERHAQPATFVSGRASWEADLAGILAGVLFGCCPLLWEQIRIPEVYAAHVFLVSWALYYWTRFEVTRASKYILFAAMPMGLGLAHHVTMVYMLPAAGLYLLLRRPFLLGAWLAFPLVWLVRRFGARSFLATTEFRHWWVVWAGCLVGGLPLLSYGYFLWANDTTTGVSWGAVHDWNSLYDHVTGKQYRGYMKGPSFKDFDKRVGAMPTMFVKQYLVGATLAWAVGLMVLARRAWPYALFLLSYAALNLYHGAQYKVGDFRNYYLPATVVAAMVLGVGVWWLARRGCYRVGGRSLFAWCALGALCLSFVAGVLYYYGHHARPRPAGLPAASDLMMVYPLAGLAFVGLMVAGVGLRRSGIGARAARYPGLSLTVLGVVAAVYGTVIVSRGLHYARLPAGGAEYAEAVTRTVPPGGVYLTLGDGKCFPMFYSQHVLNEGREFAVVDTRMIRRPWYRAGYLQARHPVSCDPLDPRFEGDLGLFFEECGSYAQRLRAHEEGGKSWLKFGFGAVRSGRRTKRASPLNYEIKHGGNPKCKKPKFRRRNGKRCDCWDYNTHERAWDLGCAYTSEEQAVVRFNVREIDAHRFIEDYIDERAIFERTVFTRWIAKHKNGRQWNGPSNRRISGEYQLINRGRINQVFYAEDLRDHDPCAGDTLTLLQQPRTRAPVATRKPAKQRRSYQENPRPQLLDYSVLTAGKTAGKNNERFEFDDDEDVQLSMHWFERNYYAPKKKSRMGARIFHGVRICFFDPAGKNIHTSAVRTVGKEGKVRLPASATTMAGTYTVQACSVGELGRKKGKRARKKGRPTAQAADIPATLRCAYPILEYQFEVSSEGIQR